MPVSRTLVLFVPLTFVHGNCQGMWRHPFWACCQVYSDTNTMHEGSMTIDGEDVSSLAAKRGCSSFVVCVA